MEVDNQRMYMMKPNKISLENSSFKKGEGERKRKRDESFDDRDILAIQELMTLRYSCAQCHKDLSKDCQPRKMHIPFNATNSIYEPMPVCKRVITLPVCNACGIRWARCNNKHCRRIVQE